MRRGENAVIAWLDAAVNEHQISSFAAPEELLKYYQARASIARSRSQIADARDGKTGQRMVERRDTRLQPAASQLEQTNRLLLGIRRVRWGSSRLVRAAAMPRPSGESFCRAPAMPGGAT